MWSRIYFVLKNNVFVSWLKVILEEIRVGLIIQWSNKQIQKRVDLFLHSSSDYVFYVGIEWPKKKPKHYNKTII